MPDEFIISKFYSRHGLNIPRKFRRSGSTAAITDDNPWDRRLENYDQRLNSKDKFNRGLPPSVSNNRFFNRERGNPLIEISFDLRFCENL